MERNSCKLFVGGLSWGTTDEALNAYFSKFGKVSDCVVMKKKESGQHRGFGFVTYSEVEVANSVLKHSPYQLDGRRIEVRPSDPLASPKVVLGTNTPRIFLGGLPSNLTESEMRSFFEGFGPVIDAVIIVKDDKRQKGFGFISFQFKETAKAIINGKFLKIKDKVVEVKLAAPRPSDRALLEPFGTGDNIQIEDIVQDDDLILFSKNEPKDEDSSDSDSVITVIQKF